ncbi:MAG: ADP-glyceromanno-heptose 6-epimerase precursor [Tardiphaga sp.]|nr:ADP-glyceromanno-heptose 6-epimerase precursor [Tardiphaga sp.]
MKLRGTVDRMLLVTGGAGFIGSNLVAALNDAGRSDVVVCDTLGHDGKWRNLAKRQLADIVPPGQIDAWLAGRKLDAIFHLGAISETTATDGDLVVETNFRLSVRLLDWCTANTVPFVYASSAATYGDGAQGFVDDPSLAAMKQLRPMNLYGWSKLLFDKLVAERAARRDPLPPQCVGLRFFNVFGPNEYHKGSMMSVLTKRFDDIRSGRDIQLFRSHRDGVADGDQRRDFIYIDDVIRVMLWLLKSPAVSGLFNVGTGEARSFKEMMLAAYAALGAPPRIEYIDMPEAIRDSYQYFTQSDGERLRRAGYNGGFTSLEDSVSAYVSGYLNTADRYR